MINRRTLKAAMSDPTDKTILMTLVSTAGQRARAKLLIESIRSFGGNLSDCPIWLFESDPQGAPCGALAADGVDIHPLVLPDTVKDYWFGAKVTACSRAEELARPGVRSLIWLSSDCLIVKPPILFDLDPAYDAAARPVHIRNVGLGANEPLDDFWRGVYKRLGVSEIQTTVESFVDVQRIRAYLNSHILAVNPTRGIFRRWFDEFEALVCDQDFQKAACQEVRHQVFLHQAVLSALIVTMIELERIHILPPDYSYPYNLHESVPPGRRAQTLNDLVCITYEDRPLDPDLVDDIEIDEPLRSWLSAHTKG